MRRRRAVIRNERTLKSISLLREDYRVTKIESILIQREECVSRESHAIDRKRVRVMEEKSAILPLRVAFQGVGCSVKACNPKQLLPRYTE